MEPTPFVQIARLVKKHGTAGELSASELAGPLDELPHGLAVWVVPPPEHPLQLRLSGVRPGPKGPLLTLSGIDTPERARELVGRYLLADQEGLPDGWLGEHAADPIGLEVIDVERGRLGRVVDTIATGANDVWVVSGGSVGEVLLPVIDDVVLSVDEERRTAKVRLLPGLIDEG